MKNVKLIGLATAIILVLLISIACGQEDADLPEKSNQSNQNAEQATTQATNNRILYIAEPISILDIGVAPMSFGASILHDNQIIIPAINSGIKYADEHIGEYDLGWSVVGGNVRVEDLTEVPLGGERRVVGVDAFYGIDFFTIPVFELISIDIEFSIEDIVGVIPFDVGDFVRILAVDVSTIDNVDMVRLLLNVYSEEHGSSLRSYQFPFFPYDTVAKEIDLELVGSHHTIIQDAWFDIYGNLLMSTINTQSQSQSLVVLDSLLSNRLASLEINNATTFALDDGGQLWGIEERVQFTGGPNSILRPLDTATWTWGNETILPLYDVLGLHVAPDESIFKWFAHTPFTLYGIKDEGELIEYISWLNVDVSVAHDTTLLFPADGEILVLNQVPNAFDDIFMTLDSVILRRADGATVDEREILTVGGVNLTGDRALIDLMRRFNRESETHRAVIVDYAEQGWDGAPIRMQTELMTGSGPDVILLSQWGDRNDIAQALMRGGFLADLNIFLESDPDLSRSDFFENILDIWVNDAGEQSLIVSTVIPTPYWGNAENLIDFTDFTHAGFLEFLKSSKEQGIPYPMGVNYLPMVVLQTMLFADDTFFCYETSEANFDSELFLDILEFAGSIPEEQQVRWVEMLQAGKALNPIPFMTRGEQLLTSMFGFITVDDFRVFDTVVGGLTAIGAPNNAGAVAISARPITRMGIRANSPNLEAAWEFIRLELMQPNTEGITGLPVMRMLFEDDIQSSMHRGEFESGGFFGFGNEAVIPELSEERAGVLRSIMEHITHEYHPNPFIMDIIWEEVTPFLAGTRSAEDAARIIQSRVQIYLHEQQR